MAAAEITIKKALALAKRAVRESESTTLAESLVIEARHCRECFRSEDAAEGVRSFVERREAVFRGAMERLAPILMTALAAGLALIPLALSGHKPGSEIQTPMAIVILFGLLTSMLLNMIVVPALYLRFGRKVEVD